MVMLNCWWCHTTTDLHASADPGSYDHRLNWAPLPINRVCGFRWPEPVHSANHDPHTPSSAPSSNITCRKGGGSPSSVFSDLSNFSFLFLCMDLSNFCDLGLDWFSDLGVVGSLFLAAPLGLQAPSPRQKVQPISLTNKPFWFEEQLGKRVKR